MAENETGADDLFVPLGNLEGKTVKRLREVLAASDAARSNYEELTEDFIKTFNHAVTQGVPVEWALFSFTQAFAITLGMCLRANFSFEEAKQLLQIILDNAKASRVMVQQVTLIGDETIGKTKQ